VNDLPAWLFDHIKKKNLDKLRNFHINTNLSKLCEDNEDAVTTDRYGTNLKPVK
jgi:alpha-D-ribose 1-methylphosphonate 5-triphosphate synthase subunit PhnH